MTRKVIAVSAALLLAASVGTAQGGGADTLPLQQPDVLTVGIDVPAPGFTDGTASGTTVKNPRGFEIDLARAVAAKLKLKKVVWVRAPFTGLFSPSPKDYDFAFEQVTITSQRKRVVDFSTPYFDANQGVLLSKEAKVVKTLAGLRALQVCGQASTTGLDYIKTKLKPSKKTLVYQTTAAALQGLQTGKCEAFIMDVPIVASAKKQKPTAYGPVTGQIVTREQYGAVFEKGNPLRPTIDRTLKALKADGTIGKLQKKWFSLNFGKITVLR